MVPYLSWADTRKLDSARQSTSRVRVGAMRVLALPFGAAAATSRPPRGPASSAASRRGQSARAHRSTTRDAISATRGVAFSAGARASGGRVHRGEGAFTRASSPDDRASTSSGSSSTEELGPSSGSGYARHEADVETTEGLENEVSSRTASFAATTTLSPSQAARRMWTRADPYHVHGISGGLFTVLGAGVLGAWAKQDADALAAGSLLSISEGLELWPAASCALLVAGVCALSGVPLGRLRGWRKTELSARTSLFQLVLTWQALRLGASFQEASPEGPQNMSALAAFADEQTVWAFCLAPFAWQTLTSAYILFFTKDDRRSAVLVAGGAWLFGAQVFPVAAVLARSGGLEALHATRPALVATWCHSLVGLVWLLNWSTFGASLRARKVVDDAGYRKWFLLRPSAAWIALFALDVGAFAPFASVGEYLVTRGGAGLID